MARMQTAVRLFLAVSSAAMATSAVGQELTTLNGRILDADTGVPLAARLYIQSADGRWFFARSADERGSAISYSKQHSPASAEMHTALSAHPFTAQLPLARYTLTVERGKEYLPHVETIELGARPASLTIRLRRWIDMTRDGWYSGETHVHRSLNELPTAMLADDLNVALPLTYWVTQSNTPPTRGDKNSPGADMRLIEIDPTHVIYPMNTEYEIFTVSGKRHTLGAIFALNHKTPLELGVPPVLPVAERVHGEGGLLELDKHNWPWSMMLVPVMKVDLYELANNHMWRTEFFYRQFGEEPPSYMNVQRDQLGITETGWIDFTFQNYYCLLNCGFRLRPTAGTASGVHPVPLGYGRVYVHTGETFSYDAWIEGLGRGRSFVTTGPMLVVQFNGEMPGHAFEVDSHSEVKFRVQGSCGSQQPLSRIEIISAGEVVKALDPGNQRTGAGAFQSRFDETIDVASSTWLAVRCYEPTSGDRVRFAHSAPVHIDVAGRPLRPRRAEVQYLIDRVQSQIDRNRGILPDAALEEYHAALELYQQIARTAR